MGPSHYDVTKSISNLANVYQNQARYAEAEQLFKRALAIREAAFGPDHLHVADALSSLGGGYLQQGRLARPRNSSNVHSS